MSEIIYEETSKGNFEPRPSGYQRRKKREHDEARDTKLTLLVYIPLAALGFIAWVAFNFFLAGGRL